MRVPLESQKSMSESNSSFASYRREDSRMQLLEMNASHLYGRQDELDYLNQELGSVNNGFKSKICLIHGLSGTGKTALCREFGRSFGDSFFFVEGKYDQLLGATTPYSAIVDAFDQLGTLVSHDGEEPNSCVRDCLEYEGSLLTKLIPSFSTYGDTGDATESLDVLMLASERLQVAFLSFLRAFCRNVHPMILFLDDLQWMDIYSRHLLVAIVNDTDLENFLFVGSFRDEEPFELEPFLSAIPTANADLLLENLKLSAVNALVSGVLRSSEDESEPLALLVHRKTAGNPYFILQQLHKLNMENLLTYNFVTLKWDWDIDVVNAGTDLSENVADVVSSRLVRSPYRVRCILKVAACLGCAVDVDILRSLDMLDLCKEMNETARPSRELFDIALSRAVEEGFVECAGNRVKFSHDRIQQCVYDLVEKGNARDMLHYRIGQYLQTAYNEMPSPQLLFLAADQLNRSSSWIKTDEERLLLIKLNYDASLTAKQKAGIESVATFLGKSVTLVRPSFWKFHYDLILAVHNSFAEVEFSLGHHEVSNEMIDIILENAVREIDTVRALIVKFQMYGHQRQFQKAIKQGRSILQLVGEPLPSTSLWNVIIEYIKARRETRNKPDEFFTELPPTESPNTKTAMKILQVLSVYGWNADTTFAGLAFLRGIRIAVREGSSDATPYLYSGYGVMLAQFGNEQEGFRFSQLASKICKNKESFASSCPLSQMTLNHLQLPISFSLEPLLVGYRVGLETGDLFFGSIDISCYGLVYLLCGLPLGPFAADLHCFGGQLKICRQDVAIAFICPVYQLALNLLGESDNALDLSRESILRNQDFVTESILNDNKDAQSLTMLYLQAFNAYVLEDVLLVENTMNQIWRLPDRRVGGTHMMNYFFALVDGLTGLFLTKRQPKNKRSSKRRAKQSIAELKKMSKTRPVNSIFLLSLLQAEKATFSKPMHHVKDMFDEVISQLSRSGLVHYNAIANELVGRFMLEKSDQYWAEHYLSQSCYLYWDWNARAKVLQMLELYPFIQAPDASMETSEKITIQGKSRFDATLDSLQGRKRSFHRNA